MADVLLAERMRIVQQYDLTTAVGMDKFAQEIIFWRSALCAADSKWREVPEQVIRASHKRAVLAPVVVSAMFRTKLLGDATMDSPVLHPPSAGMLHHVFHIVLIVHGRAAAIAVPHFTGGVVVLGGVQTNTVMCMHHRA